MSFFQRAGDLFRWFYHTPYAAHDAFPFTPDVHTDVCSAFISVLSGLVNVMY